MADDKPLTTDQQQQLRSKYLFDDEEEEANKRKKRNLPRQRSSIPADKSNNLKLQQNEKRFQASKNSLVLPGSKENISSYNQILFYILQGHK